MATKLVNARMHWFTDNQNVVCILQVGSRKPGLHDVALRVFSMVIQYQICLEPEWIHRGFNESVDFLCRIVDYDDWYLHPAVFVR